MCSVRCVTYVPDRSHRFLDKQHLAAGSAGRDSSSHRFGRGATRGALPRVSLPRNVCSLQGIHSPLALAAESKLVYSLSPTPLPYASRPIFT